MIDRTTYAIVATGTLARYLVPYVLTGIFLTGIFWISDLFVRLNYSERLDYLSVPNFPVERLLKVESQKNLRAETSRHGGGYH